MRILDIAVFTLIFSLTLSALNGLNMFNVNYRHEVNYTPPQPPNYTSILPRNTTMTEGEYIGWNFFLGTIYVLTNLPRILQPAYNIGGYLKSLLPILPDSLCLILTILVDTLNLIAILQVLRGVTFKWMQ